MKVNTKQLTVDEGGECWVTTDHLQLLDVDSLEDSLRMAIKRRPQHGEVYLDGTLLNQGQTFSIQDLKNIKVRSDMAEFYSLNILHFMITMLS